MRGLRGLEEVNPDNLDKELLTKLAEKHGDDRVVQALRQGKGIGRSVGPETVGRIDSLDDYSACEIKTRDDIRELFVERFYFGCEADDPMNASAFNQKQNPRRCASERALRLGHRTLRRGRHGARGA